MAFAISNILIKCNVISIEERLLKLSLQSTSKVQARGKLIFQKPRLRNPTWFNRKTRVVHDDHILPENQEFVKEVVQDRYSSVIVQGEIQPNVQWQPNLARTGVIARKIGCYPLWQKDGTQIRTTLLQVLDNHVIKQYSPEEYDPPRKRPLAVRNKKACLLIGAEATDPSLLTKEYCGLFKDSGIMPKKLLGRFFVSPEGILPVGTLITANHFRVGDYVDVRGKTIDHGFQGVVKRWGFKGMPASHGVTKTHRRPGNIGGGGEKGRVWPGTKLPGHMGNRYRFAKGLKIWRINTKYNVIWVQGSAIPGLTNSIVYIYDTKIKSLLPKEAPAFPTFVPGDEELPEDLYDESVHRFFDPTITFKESS